MRLFIAAIMFITGCAQVPPAHFESGVEAKTRVIPSHGKHVDAVDVSVSMKYKW